MPKASSIPKNNEPTPNKEKRITTNSTIIALQSNKEIEDIRYILQDSTYYFFNCAKNPP